MLDGIVLPGSIFDKHFLSYRRNMYRLIFLTQIHPRFILRPVTR